jgi:hypothetical protein
VSSDEQEKVEQSEVELEELIERIEEHPFGIITRKGYQELKKQISDYSEKIEDRFHRWFVIALTAFAVMSIATGISLVGFGILLARQSGITSQIQDQRYGALLDSCLDTNERHDNAFALIDKAIAAAPPERAKRAQESSGPFKLIINATVPYTKDCRKLARERVQGGPTTP